MLKKSLITTLKDDSLLKKYLISRFKGIDIEITNGSIQAYTSTNIKKVNPIIYTIKYQKIKVVVLYYKIEDIKDKKYYIPKLKEDYNLSELKSYFNEISN